MNYSGGFTNVTAVPEPSTIYIALALAALLTWRARRRFVARRN
ncbi:MAG: PEP-CTERM sorting domain-containing protein [Chthoniobacterales bacterium]